MTIPGHGYFWTVATRLGRGGETAGRHSVAQEIHLRDGTGALLKIDDQPGRLEAAEYLLNIPLVLLHGGASDDVIEVHEVNDSPASTRSMSCWKVLPAFRRPKVRGRN